MKKSRCAARAGPVSRKRYHFADRRSGARQFGHGWLRFSFHRPAHDADTTLNVIGTAHAGLAYEGTIGRGGQAIRIMTGALMMSATLDTVIPQEFVSSATTDSVTIPVDAVKPVANRRLVGEDLKSGTPALRQGRILRPADGIAGHRQRFGSVAAGDRQVLFFGLPGNLVVMMVSFYFFACDALLQRMGAQVAALPAVTAVNIRKSSGRTEYQRGILAMDASWYDLPPRPGFRHTALDGGSELHDRAEARSWRRDLV